MTVILCHVVDDAKEDLEMCFVNHLNYPQFVRNSFQENVHTIITENTISLTYQCTIQSSP